MKYLYKYPQRRYPYEELVMESQNRDRNVAEFEILDTDAFDEDRYWDVFVEVVRYTFPTSFTDSHTISMLKKKTIPMVYTSVS